MCMRFGLTDATTVVRTGSRGPSTCWGRRGQRGTVPGTNGADLMPGEPDPLTPAQSDQNLGVPDIGTSWSPCSREEHLPWRCPWG